MTDRETLLALKERVEKASGPDRELDHAFLALDMGDWLTENGYVRHGDDYWSERPPVRGAHSICGPSDYTDSIDAALALCERMLPGWTIAHLSQDDWKLWHVELREGHATSYDRVVLSTNGLKGTTAPLAILSALLSALSQQPAQDGDAG